MFVSQRALCVDRVLDELRLRYEREHNRCAQKPRARSLSSECSDANPTRAQRPILRRVFEGDSPPTTPMCLVVCGIRAVSKAQPLAPEQPRGQEPDATRGDAVDAGVESVVELELTDGALHVCLLLLRRG